MPNKVVKITIRLKDEFSAGLSKLSRGLKTFSEKGAGLIGKISKSFFSLKNAIVATATAGGIGLLIKNSIRAASEFETLKLRLEAVSGSAVLAEKRFKEIRKFAASTPLNLDDLVKAEILLTSVGAASQENLRQVAEVASVMGRSVEDVALAVASLEGETLKRFGIQLRKTGDEFRFQFRDKAGKALEVVAKGAEEAREALTDIFSTKFGGSLEKASQTILGKWTTFKDTVKEAFATIGQRLLPVASKVLTQATDALNSLIGSGKIGKFGDRLAKGAEELIAWLEKVTPTFDGVNDSLKVAATEAGKNFAKGIFDLLLSLPGKLVRFTGDVIAEKFPVSSAAVQDARFRNLPIAGPLPLPSPAAGIAASQGSIVGKNHNRAEMRLGSSQNEPLFVQEVKPPEVGFRG